VCCSVCCSALLCVAVYVAVRCCVLQCMLQCVAVCCSVLQCVAQCNAVWVAVCCGVLQCVAVCCKCLAVWCGVFQNNMDSIVFGVSHKDIAYRVAACCSVLQRVAACCSVLQHVPVWVKWSNGACCCSVFQACCSVLQVCCTVLQCVAHVFQCVAALLQHTATQDTMECAAVQRFKFSKVRLSGQVLGSFNSCCSKFWKRKHFSSVAVNSKVLQDNLFPLLQSFLKRNPEKSAWSL